MLSAPSLPQIALPRLRPQDMNPVHDFPTCGCGLIVAQVAKNPRIVALAAVCAVLMIGSLGERDIATSHEARVAQTAREMAASGWPWDAGLVNTPAVRLVDTPEGKRLSGVDSEQTIAVNPWAVPLINSRIRLQKPPLPYWVAAITYRWIGVNEKAARLGSALLGFLCLPLIFDLARRLIGRRAAWIAAVLWVSTYFIADEFRKAMADPYLAFFTLLAIWAWVRASYQKAAAWAVVLFYVAIALGLLAKGPVIVLHVGIAVAAFRVCYRPAITHKWNSHLLGIGLLLLIAVPWPAYVIRHVPNAIDLWRYESIGELTGENTEKGRPWHFYLPGLVQLTLPWTVLWGAALAAPFRRAGNPTRRRRRAFPLAWCLATVVFFSFSTVKKNTYLLPMLPAQVLLIAQAAAAVIALSRRPNGKRLAKTLVDAQKCIGLVFAAVVAAAILIDWTTLSANSATAASIADALRNPAWRLSAATVAIGTLALATGLLPFFASSRTQLPRWFFVQGLSYSILIALFLAAVVTPLDNARSPKLFAKIVAKAALESGIPLAKARIGEAALFYLPPNLPSDRGAITRFVVVEQRAKRPPDTSNPAYFKAHLGNESNMEPFKADLLPVGTESSRNPWRLYLIELHPPKPATD